LKACRAEGTVSPKKHAAQSANEMLPAIDYQPVVRIHDVEVDNFFADAALSHRIESLLDGKIFAQARNVLAGDVQHRLI
jgi:hypothetical protein